MRVFNGNENDAKKKECFVLAGMIQKHQAMRALFGTSGNTFEARPLECITEYHVTNITREMRV